MNDEEIKKALECCVEGHCSKCPMLGKYSCSKSLREHALDLINRQQAEIERLHGNLFTVSNACTQRRNEAIKEFAERLKEEAITKCDWDNCVDVEDIDRLVAEMVGGENA